MREICKSGSEGGGALTGSPYLYSERPLVGCYAELGRASGADGLCCCLERGIRGERAVTPQLLGTSRTVG